MHPLLPPVLVTAGCVLLLTIQGVLMAFYSPNIHERTVKLKDGREVVCLIPSGYFSRAITCDWNSGAASAATAPPETGGKAER